MTRSTRIPQHVAVYTQTENITKRGYQTAFQYYRFGVRGFLCFLQHVFISVNELKRILMLDKAE